MNSPLLPPRDPDDDTLRLECGVFGVFGVRDASTVVALTAAPTGVSLAALVVGVATLFGFFRAIVLTDRGDAV